MTLPADVLATLRARAGRSDGPRIEPVDLAGRRFWIKRREVMPFNWRIQKGNARKLFAREKQILRALHGRGVPVPPILDEGPDYMVLPDSGTNFEAIALDRAHPDRLRAFEAAGGALARLHRMGLSHGRPHPRDLCWNGESVIFLDPERGASLEAGTREFGRDLVTFVYIFLSFLPQGGNDPALLAFGAAYRAEAPEGVWQAAEAWCRRWRVLVWLSGPLRWHETRFRARRRYKRYSAIPATFRHFGVEP